LIFGFKLVNQV